MGKKESNVRPPNATKPVYGVGQMEGREGVALKDLQSPAGKRDDGGKLSWHLVPVPAMVAFCKVWHAGGLKYGDENWRGGLLFSRIYRPMMSHLNKWLCTDSSYDKELGTHHLMMVAWGCFVLYMYEVVFGRSDLDNRPDKGTLKDEDFEYLIAEKKEQDVELEALREWRDKEVFPDDEVLTIRNPHLPPLGPTPFDKDDAGRDMEYNER